MMKTKILSFMFLMGIVLIGTNAFAANETSVSLDTQYTYTVTNGNGSWSTGQTYAWSVTTGVNGTDWSATFGTGVSNDITWKVAGSYVIQVIATDSNGCLSEPLTLTVTVSDETYCFTANDNTTTCSLVDAGNGNASSSPGDTSFDVTISDPKTSGTYTVSYTVDGGATQTYDITSVVAGTDKTGTITISHSSFVSAFTNDGASNKTVSIAVTGVTNASDAAVSACASPPTLSVTVYPTPVITFN